MEKDGHNAYWNRTAELLARRINVGYWLAGLLPAIFALGMAQCLALILLRKNGLDTGLSWAVFAALALAATIVAWRRQRSRFFSRRDALVYLESRLGLNNGLTAAENGIGPWPPPRPMPAATWPTWSWKRVAPWPAWTAVALALAIWLPVSPSASTTPRTPMEPTAWSTLDSWIEALEEAEILEEAALDNFREQVEALRKQDERDWYRHSSLEATDALQERTERAIRDLRNNLEKVARIMETADAFPDGLPSGLADALREELSSALDGFESGLLRLDPELLAQLRELDLDALPALSEADLQALRECLAAGLGACGVCLSGGEGDALLAGTGGISKGPGPAPLTFRAEGSDATVSRFEAASNDDLSQAALGDHLGVGITDMPDDETAPYTGPTAAGTIAGPASGGEAVDRQNFTPDEQAVLERYFQ